MNLKKYLLDKKEEIKTKEVKDRFIDFKKTKEFAISVIGPRRAGKTYFLFNLLRNFGLKDDDYVFVNFEDDEIKSMKREELRKIISYHYEIYGKEAEYIFLDEVQNLENWQSFVYSLIESKKYYLFLTGSSSKLLSREIETQLRGRALNVIVFPFSFKEFLFLNGIEIKKFYSTIEEAKIKNYLLKYLKNGGFPQVVLGKIDLKDFSREYLSVVIYRDLIERFKIENVDAAKFLLLSVLQSFAKEFSLNKVYNQLKQKIEISNKTLYKYFTYLEEILFSFPLYKFSFSSKKAMLTIPKIYVNDCGIAASKYEDFGRLMENLVFLELKKKELQNIFEIYYYKDYQQNEVDFVIKEGLEVKQLIQVTNASSKDEIEKRELNGLKKASNLLNCKDLRIITWDYEDKLVVENKEVKCIPLWKWLLNIE